MRWDYTRTSLQNRCPWITFWVISQPNVDGFCFNLAHFVACSLYRICIGGLSSNLFLGRVNWIVFEAIAIQYRYWVVEPLFLYRLQHWDWVCWCIPAHLLNLENKLRNCGDGLYVGILLGICGLNVDFQPTFSLSSTKKPAPFFLSWLFAFSLTKSLQFFRNTKMLSYVLGQWAVTNIAYLQNRSQVYQNKEMFMKDQKVLLMNNYIFFSENM